MMGRGLAVSGGLGLQGAGVASSSPVVSPTHAATPPFRKSAKIVHDPRLRLAEARAILRSHAKETIYGAFPAASRHQTCVNAAYACGTSPDTILRLIEGETGTPDAMVLAYCAARFEAMTGKVSPILSVLAEIMALGAEVLPDPSFRPEPAKGHSYAQP